MTPHTLEEIHRALRFEVFTHQSLRDRHDSIVYASALATIAGVTVCSVIGHWAAWVMLFVPMFLTCLVRVALSIRAMRDERMAYEARLAQLGIRPLSPHERL